jgi:hypothetical protein
MIDRPVIAAFAATTAFAQFDPPHRFVKESQSFVAAKNMDANHKLGNILPTLHALSSKPEDIFVQHFLKKIFSRGERASFPTTLAFFRVRAPTRPTQPPKNLFCLSPRCCQVLICSKNLLRT